MPKRDAGQAKPAFLAPRAKTGKVADVLIARATDMNAPIALFYWPTPNGWKVSVCLKEMGLPYTTHLINIGKGDQIAPDFLKIAPKADPPQDIPYAKDRYRAETARLYGVLDRQLAQHEYVAGDFVSIADFSILGWASLWEGQQQTLEDKPHMARWLDLMGRRKGVQAGRALFAELRG